MALNLEIALGRRIAAQLGVASMKRHALSWTRPPAIMAASSPPASGTRSEVLEPSVIYEAKDGKYGEDGSEVLGNLCYQVPVIETLNKKHKKQ